MVDETHPGKTVIPPGGGETQCLGSSPSSTTSFRRVTLNCNSFLRVGYFKDY